jgi:hypothetical protein
VIARSWSGKVPVDQADGFYRHLLATGISDYRAQPGCLDIGLWRRDADGWAIFTLTSLWQDMDSVRAYAGERPDDAVLYPDDEVHGLVPDLTVQHHAVLDTAP